jgi:hypothetical protein
MFNVVEIPLKGKGAIACEKIVAGGLVLRCESPLFALVNDPDNVCSWCFRDGDPFGPPMRRKCEKCNVARYCSDRCRELARAFHSEVECEALLRCRDLVDDEDADDVTSVLIVRALRQGGRAERFKELCWQPDVDVAHVSRVANKAGGER